MDFSIPDKFLVRVQVNISYDELFSMIGGFGNNQLISLEHMMFFPLTLKVLINVCFLITYVHYYESG